MVRSTRTRQALTAISLFVPLLLSAACGPPEAESQAASQPTEALADGATTAECQAVADRAAAVTGAAVTLVLVPGRGQEASTALTTLSSDGDFDGVAVVAAYGSPENYKELARAAITGVGTPNPLYANAQKARARRCLAAKSIAELGHLPEAGPEAVNGDALTALALGFEAARSVTGDAHPARVIVYGAGSLVTSGLDLAAADLSTPALVDAVVAALSDNGLLRLGGGPKSELVFAGLGDDAVNAVAARQRQNLFVKVCRAVDVTSCTVTMGVAR